ncbi:MAG: oxidoreductase [Pirellulales bacterium]|nr:oxidoreductase [Pirellulales bacterium]
MPSAHRPTLAVFKFASCDGCQLTLLDAEDELLTLAGQVDVAYFLEASSRAVEGVYDLALVEGSITTAADAARIQEVRQRSRYLVTIGACATAGGIQALRNWANHAEFLSAVYARPDYLDSLATSTPISDHVAVDYELRGCPINKVQLLEVLRAFLHGIRPRLPDEAVCGDCKRRGTVCIWVARGVPCVGPVTHAGCGAICPAYERGCYGCYGPTGQPNVVALSEHLAASGVRLAEVQRALRNFNGYAPEFREASERLVDG